METENNKYNSLDNEVIVWIEQESIHIKAVDIHGDPVELTKAEALELAVALQRLANKIVT